MGRYRGSSVSSFESDGFQSDASELVVDDTDPTDVETDSADEEVRRETVLLAEDQELPDEYWRKQHDELNDSDFDGQDYNPDTVVSLDRVEAQWKECVIALVIPPIPFSSQVALTLLTCHRHCKCMGLASTGRLSNLHGQIPLQLLRLVPFSQTEQRREKTTRHEDHKLSRAVLEELSAGL